MVHNDHERLQRMIDEICCCIIHVEDGKWKSGEIGSRNSDLSKDRLMILSNVLIPELQVWSSLEKDVATNVSLLMPVFLRSKQMRKKSCNISSLAHVESNLRYKCITWVLDGLLHFEWCAEFVDAFKGTRNKHWFVHHYRWDPLEHLRSGEAMAESKADGDEDHEEPEVLTEEEKMANIRAVRFTVIPKYAEILQEAYPLFVRKGAKEKTQIHER